MRNFADVTGFPSEEVMLKNYSYGNGINIGYKILAIVFEETDYEHFVSKHLAYTLRSSYDTPDLFSGVLKDARFYHIEQLFFSSIPYVKTQMCIDESFINISAGNSFSRQVISQNNVVCEYLIRPMIKAFLVSPRQFSKELKRFTCIIYVS